MREIKFRAWDKELKKWFSPTLDANGIAVVEERHEEGCGCGAVYYGTHFIEYPRQYELVQYTGIKDKNGKEIYDGDVVKDGDAHRVIKWDDSRGNHVIGYWAGFTILDYRPKDSEIIGNIYENPELLNPHTT